MKQINYKTKFFDFLDEYPITKYLGLVGIFLIIIIFVVQAILSDEITRFWNNHIRPSVVSEYEQVSLPLSSPEANSFESDSETKFSENNDNSVAKPTQTPLHERNIDDLIMGARPWQVAYFNLLSNPLNYHDEYDLTTHGGMFALVDLNGSGVPELIIVFFHPLLGGNISGKIYSFNGLLIYHGIIDIFYMRIYQTGLRSYPGIFAVGGRSSNFSGHYFTIENDELIHKQLWKNYFDGYELLSYSAELVEASRELRGAGLEVSFKVINRNNVIDTIFGHPFF